MTLRAPLLLVLLTLLFPVPYYAFEPSPCSQPSSVRESLMRQAEQNQFTLRRVEFIGLTYTRDDVVRPRMTRFKDGGRTLSFNEGDLFSRYKLVQSLRSVSRLRSEIYPVRLSDVEVRLNQSEKTIDMAICFKPKRR